MLKRVQHDDHSEAFRPSSSKRSSSGTVISGWTMPSAMAPSLPPQQRPPAPGGERSGLERREAVDQEPEAEVELDPERQALVSFDDDWAAATRALVAGKECGGGGG